MKRPSWRIPIFSRKAPLSPLPPGASPGTLTAPADASPPRITVLAYDAEQMVEEELDDPAAISDYLESWPVSWINIDGLGDTTVVEQVGSVFGIHPLALEDVLNIRHRPKIEEYDEHIFVVTRMAGFDDQFEPEQVSLFLSSNYVLTFQERQGDCLEPVRNRLRTKKGKIRQRGPDYLAYAVLDAVVDGYFPVLEQMSERLEELEDEILRNPKTETVARIQGARHEMLTLRRSVAPQREIFNSMVRDGHDVIGEEVGVYLRDTQDHVIRIVEIAESYREVASGLMDLYMSSVSNRMNDIMKVLTIMATMFIPLTFVAGIYGMNFDPDVSPFNMPELRWFWGYPFALGLMVVMTVGLLVYFRRKGWIGS